MSLILGIPAFFLILALLILVHEAGHFTAAKLSDVRVDEFGLGFPPRLKTWWRGETMYSLNAIPLGGFVKMQGENGETDDPRSFGAKPPWKRLIILLAGPGMNLILALLVLFAVFVIGTPRSTAVVTQVSANSPAQSAGLRAGDRVLSFAGQKVKYLDDLQAITENHQGERVLLVFQRAGTLHSVYIKPRVHPPLNQGRIGVRMDDTVTVRYTPVHSISMAFNELGQMVASLPLLAHSIANHDSRNVSGPIGIAHMTTQVVNQEPTDGPSRLLIFIALLSANLGILNLLPIPALDGGRIVFVLLSWIRRRNLDPELEGVIHLVGMAVLLVLILVISYQDVVRWVSGGSF